MSKSTDRLNRYFSNRYSRKDSLFVRELFANKGKKDILQKELETHWERFELNVSQQEKKFEDLRNQIQYRIYLEENKKIRLSPLWRLQRIAAILFIPLLLGFMSYLLYSSLQENQVSYAEIQCPAGARTKFTLPDGSTGYLNNGSTLKYAIPFNDSRNVNLTGEAFFEVIKTGQPFHVKTQTLDVTVLGTTFNVIAYQNDETEEVILQTGKINISTSKGKNLTTLTPNQLLTYDRTSQNYRVLHVDASQFTAWREGKLVFRNESLEEVAKRLGRWYNVDVEIADKQLKNYTLHATFMNHSLEEVLQLISFTSPMKYKIHEQKQNKSNQYLRKKQVILKLDRSKINQYN